MNGNNHQSSSYFPKALRFLKLFFWVLPISRERQRERLLDMVFCYAMIVLCVAYYVFLSPPFVLASNFPLLESLEVVEGTIVRHETRRVTRYTAEPIGIKTKSGVVFKECGVIGVPCLASHDKKTTGWDVIEGRSARMWYWNDRVVQLEIDGSVSNGLSYEQTRERFSKFPGAMWVLLIAMSYLIVQLSRRHFCNAVAEAFNK